MAPLPCQTDKGPTLLRVPGPCCLFPAPEGAESLLGDVSGQHSLRPGLNDDEPVEYGDIFSALASEDAEFRELFRHEFDELEDVNPDGSNEGM